MGDKIRNLLEKANFNGAEDASVTFAKRAFLAEIEAESFFIKVKKAFRILANGIKIPKPAMNYSIKTVMPARAKSSRSKNSSASMFPLQVKSIGLGSLIFMTGKASL